MGQVERLLLVGNFDELIEPFLVHLKPLPFQQRLAARTTARVSRARSLSGGSFGAFNGARNATSSARSLIVANVAMISSTVMTPPSRHARRGVARPNPRVPISANRQSAGLGELAWAPNPRSVGRTKLMWERPLVRIAAPRARHPWACWFALDRLVFV